MITRIRNIPLVNAWLRRPPFHYANAMKVLNTIASMDRAQREAFQVQRIQHVLNIAQKLPGYANVQTSSDLHQWPILEKSALAGREPAFLPHIWGPKTAASTGGTTGQPLRLQRSLQGVAFEQAFIDRLCLQAGQNPRTARVAVLRGDSIKDPNDLNPPYWVNQGARRRVFSAHHLSTATAQHYCAALREFAPNILFCYPSALAQLLKVSAGENISIPLIFASSEILDPQVARDSAQRFNASIIDFYGHAERTAAAYSFDQRSYWFDPAYGHIELVPEGDGLASIVATSLWTNGQVFVRYRTGDLARVDSHDGDYLRDVALGLRSFPGLEGRASEFIDLPGGRRIIGLNHIPRDVPGAASVQLRLAADASIEVFIAVAKDQIDPALAAVRKNLSVKFPKDTRFRFFQVDSIMREANGKAPLLLRNPVIHSNNKPVRLNAQVLEPLS